MLPRTSAPENMGPEIMCPEIICPREYPPGDYPAPENMRLQRKWSLRTCTSRDNLPP